MRTWIYNRLFSPPYNNVLSSSLYTSPDLCYHLILSYIDLQFKCYPIAWEAIELRRFTYSYRNNRAFAYLGRHYLRMRFFHSTLPSLFIYEKFNILLWQIQQKQFSTEKMENTTTGKSSAFCAKDRECSAERAVARYL